MLRKLIPPLKMFFLLNMKAKASLMFSRIKDAFIF